MKTQTSHARSIERVVFGSQFEQIYTEASCDAKREANRLIQELDKDGLEKWLSEQLLSEYSDKSIRFLRKRGQSLGVPFYYSLCKASLLSEILKYEQIRRSIARSGQTSY